MTGLLFLMVVILCLVFCMKSSKNKKKLSFFQQRLEREQKKQSLKHLFCEETDLPNINYIQKKLLNKNNKNHSVMHVICVGRTADFYKFFDSKTSKIIKSELHCHLSENLSPSIMGLFEGKYIIIIFDSDKPALEKDIIEQQQKIQYFLPSEKKVDNKKIMLDYSVASMKIPSLVQPLDKNKLFRRMAYSVNKSCQCVDGLYVYNVNDYNESVKRRHVIQALHSDIQQGGAQFELFYQPVVYSMRTSKDYLWEILLRWKRTQYGGPGSFMPLLATEPHLHYALTMMIFNKLIEYSMATEKTLPNFSINISHTDLSIVSFYDDVMESTKGAPGLRSSIIFEIVEYSEGLSGGNIKENIELLKKAGFRFAIDDFGCGYSNFNLLSKKHFDFIKLDKSLLKKCQNDIVASETLKFMVKLSELIGVTLIVEGVETPLHLRLLPKKAHVLFQGFHFYKPMKLTNTLALTSVSVPIQSVLNHQNLEFTK
ncbi:EAL domain-containing protein [Vibrio crassostreae]|uniref:EAL domain-containing protein n=4 Tax=Vibrio TaxID=662 RepID=UPI00062F17B8|nr:EAL domain-containing protein [Vibrio crassostreae]TCU03977.1 EAL domain-containing protein (putative c-di-GMP-specific phosphodiesterase class I) [Vibrio crassostreae]CAK1927442.1 EAL domain-containing protein [Vibrio crassostreae]CAK1957877.1 EAL domain-containing protein [Vibrio crassostreae]CAK2239680.1 EAL domain-containing protein [Vibrio crassostreae]CAK2596230.1 EAL domain-containing protein [Vibrio crassostreae]